MSLFPFKPGTQVDAAHRALINTINSPDYQFALPELTEPTWDLICSNDRESERLEFVGDALMSAAIAEELHRTHPAGSPGFYTNVKMVLTANSTFAHLMAKVGFHDIADPVKPAGDAFETIMAAFHHESGVEAFHMWIRRHFTPLICSAGIAYKFYRKYNMNCVEEHKKPYNSRYRQQLTQRNIAPPGSIYAQPIFLTPQIDNLSMQKAVTLPQAKPLTPTAYTNCIEWKDEVQELSPNTYTKQISLTKVSVAQKSPIVPKPTSKTRTLSDRNGRLPPAFSRKVDYPQNTSQNTKVAKPCIHKIQGQYEQNTIISGSASNPIIID